MLHIDLEKIPLDARDEEWIREEIQQRVLNHQIPTPTHKDLSRLVVINPDNQSIQPSPPSLEAVLRRSLLPVHISNADIPATQIIDRIFQGKDPIRLLVIQTHNSYPGLSDFLFNVNALRLGHPAVRIVFDGSSHSILTHLQALIKKGWQLRILWKDGHESELNTVEELTERISHEDSAQVMSRPFFRALRIRHNANSPIQTCAPQQMGEIGQQYWVETQVIAGSHRLKPRVVETPMENIHSWLLSATPGSDFAGFRINNVSITSQTLRTHETVRTWIPKDALQTLSCMLPDRHLKTIPLEQVRAIRVNVVTGETALMFRSIQNKHRLDEAEAFVLLQKPVHVAGSSKNSVGQQEGYWDDFEIEMDTKAPANHGHTQSPVPKGGESEGGAPEEDVPNTTQTSVQVRIDRISLPSKYATIGHSLQHTVFECWVDSILRNDLAIQRRQQHYSRDLRFAIVGTLAAQTIHLLQRFGLKNWISKDRLYYLGENPQSITDTQALQKETEADWETLATLVKDIFSHNQNKDLDMEHIWRTLPTCLDLSDRQAMPFAEVTAEQLNAIYNEMTQLRILLGHEFQSRFGIGAMEVYFFSRITDCRKAALYSRKLLNLRQGLWGKVLPKSYTPDLIIYDNKSTLAQQHNNWALPTISCNELLGQSKNIAVFEKNAVQFGTLLEEKLAVAENRLRQDGGQIEHPNQLLDAFNEELEKALEVLRTHMQTASTLQEKQDDKKVAAQIEKERSTFLSHIAWMQDELRRLAPNMADAQTRKQNAIQSLPLHHTHTKDETHALRSLEILEKQHSVQTLKIIEAWQHAAVRVAQGLRLGKENAVHFLALRSQWLQQNLMVLITKHRQTSPQRWHSHVASLHHSSALQLIQREEKARAKIETIQTKIDAFEQTVVLRGRGREEVLNNLSKQRETLAQDLIDLSRESDLLESNFLTKLIQLVRTRLGRVGKNMLYSESTEKLGPRQENEIKEMFIARTSVINTQIEYDAIRSVRLKEGDAPVAPSSRITAEEVNKIRMETKQAKQRVVQREHGLRQALEALHQINRPMLQAVELLLNLQRHHEELRLAVLQCQRIALSQQHLQARLEQAKMDIKNMDTVLRERLVPAQVKLLEGIFIPEAEQDVRILKQGKTFLQDALQMQDGDIQDLLQQRTIHKRFHLNQFLAGAMVESDPADPESTALRNATQALRMLGEAAGKTLKHWQVANARDNPPLSLGRLPLDNMAQHLRQKLERIKRELCPTWVALPVNMPIEAALAAIEVFQKKPLDGNPITFIWTGRFNRSAFRHNLKLRKVYFEVARRNLIINFSDTPMASNTKDVCHYLLQETLGCCQDAPINARKSAS